MTRYEENADYINKVERSLRTLHSFRSELRGYSRLLTLADGIHLGMVRRSSASGSPAVRPAGAPQALRQPHPCLTAIFQALQD